MDCPFKITWKWGNTLVLGFIFCIFIFLYVLYIQIPSAALLTIRDSFSDVKMTVSPATVWLGITGDNCTSHFIYSTQIRLIYDMQTVFIWVRYRKIQHCAVFSHIARIMNTVCIFSQDQVIYDITFLDCSSTTAGVRYGLIPICEKTMNTL